MLQDAILHVVEAVGELRIEAEAFVRVTGRLKCYIVAAVEALLSAGWCICKTGNIAHVNLIVDC